MKSAKQYWHEAERRAAEANLLFLQFVKDGMTREQLARLISRRPSLWGRFSVWLDKLPESNAV